MILLKQQLIDIINNRLEEEISKQNPVKFLKKYQVEDYIDIVISVTYLYTRMKKGKGRKQILIHEVISAIGHGVRNRMKLKKDSALAAKSGAFLLYSFEALGILRVILGAAQNGHAVYIIEVKDDDALSALWEGLAENKTEKLPSSVPYADWVTYKHECGAILIKTNNKEVLNIVTPETHPIVFDTVNRAQHVGWNINKDVYDLHLWALRNKTDAFSEIWNNPDPEAKLSKMREATAIGDIAKRFIDKTFYHLYYTDFRGRKYPTTAYLHEQGSDLAKGLLLREDKKAIGEQGFFWLLISIANNWGGDCGREDGAKSDKIPLNDRVYWALDNEEIILSYADNPKVNQGWMKADKPWQFIAAVLEFKKLRDWQQAEKETKWDSYDEYGYESHIEVYIDGSNNGSQHLSALTKDEVTAPYVNLVPLELPGDLYTYVGDSVWQTIKEQVDSLTKEELIECNKVIDTLSDLKARVSSSLSHSELRTEAIQKLKAYRKEHQETIAKACPVFWHRITDIKQRRKVVKRNVMTLPYGGSAYGLGQQQIDDSTKHGIKALIDIEHKFGAYMGTMVFNNCKLSLKRPMRLLEVFEEAGKKAEEEGRFLSWTVPLTNFPVVQHYVEGVTKKIYVPYGPPTGIKNSSNYDENTLQLSICFIEECIPTKRKQAQGASPNAIHSLDAAHLMLTAYRAEFPVTTIHDSFGCLLGDMPELFVLIRETFVELYKADPLTHIMNQIGGNISKIEIGKLNIESILDSEYAFA